MNENNGKSKGKRGRSKKFEGESKVVSFRIQKDVYEGNKDEIRKKINGVIENEVDNINRKGKIKKKFKSISRNFLSKRKSGNEIKGITNFNVNHKVDLKSSINSVPKIYPVKKQIEGREEREDLDTFYYDKKSEVKEKLKEIIDSESTEKERIRNKKKMNKKQIFDEFKDFIDVDNKEFKEFMD